MWSPIRQAIAMIVRDGLAPPPLETVIHRKSRGSGRPTCGRTRLYAVLGGAPHAASTHQMGGVVLCPDVASISGFKHLAHEFQRGRLRGALSTHVAHVGPILNELESEFKGE